MGNIFSVNDELKKIRNEIQKRNQIMEMEIIKLQKRNIEFQKKLNDIEVLINKIETIFN